jgi:UDP-2,4-diacetamido-2,4,6-trideoxy-beta-L-altropyranose hydrolase
MKRIAIVTEGDVQMGMGHVTRSLALAEKLRAHGTVIFATHSPPEVQHKIEAQGFQVMVDMEYEKSLQSFIPDVVVIDKLQVEEKLAKHIRYNLGCRLAILGNISPANQHAHVVVNAVIGADLSNVRRQDSVNGTLYLEGPAYVVLRDEFYRLRGQYCKKSEINNVLLMFGGSDPANLTCQMLGQLFRAKGIQQITICLGLMFPHGAELRHLLDEQASKSANLPLIQIVRDISNVPDLMIRHDFLLTSAGITLFEAFSLEIPVLAFFQNKLQRTIFHGYPFTMENANVSNLLPLMKQQQQNYEAYLDNIRPLKSGRGIFEIVDSIISEDAVVFH